MPRQVAERIETLLTGLFSEIELQRSMMSTLIRRLEAANESFGALQSDLQSIQKEKDDEETLRQCVVCMDAPRDILLSPCHHLVVCTNCVENLGTECPMCRKRIRKTIRVYW